MPSVTALEWAILQRFVSYVHSSPGGSVELLGAASWTAEGAIVFPYDAIEPEGTLRFSGGVRFVAHGGMLDVAVDDVRLELSGVSFEITIAGDSPDDRFALAAGATSGLLAGAPIDVRLTDDGSDLFFRRYPEGYDLDPLRLRLAHG
jgi:Htaa